MGAKFCCFHLPIPVSATFEKLAVDVLGPLPTTCSGNRYIVCFVEYLTKWLKIFAAPDMEAVTIAQLITDEIIPRHGAPDFAFRQRNKFSFYLST